MDRISGTFPVKEWPTGKTHHLVRSQISWFSETSDLIKGCWSIGTSSNNHQVKEPSYTEFIAWWEKGFPSG